MGVSENHSDYLIEIKGESFHINLQPLWDFFKSNIWKIIGIGLFFFFLGIMVALLSPVEYTSEIKLIQENPVLQNDRSSNLFRNMNFFNANKSSGIMGAELYPDIVKSTPFLLEIINQDVFFVKYDSAITIGDYFSKIQKPSLLDIVRNNTIGLPSKIKSLIEGKPEFSELPVTLFDKDSTSKQSNGFFLKKEEPLEISRSQINIIKKLTDRIFVSISDYYVVISTKMPDPVATAALTNLVYQQLTEHIIYNKTSEAMQEMLFIQERTDEAKKEFYKTQNDLAEFRDRNMNITTARAKSDEQRLSAEYELAFNLYKTLSQQLEQAKIKVKENTPVFDVLEPVKIPIEKSEPERFKIVFRYFILGIFFGFFFFGLVFLKNNYHYLLRIEK